MGGGEREEGRGGGGGKARNSNIFFCCTSQLSVKGERGEKNTHVFGLETEDDNTTEHDDRHEIGKTFCPVA